jgi:hypothetical protein
MALLQGKTAVITGGSTGTGLATAKGFGEVTQEHLRKALPRLNDGGSIILNSSDTNAAGNDGIGVYAAIVAALRSLPRPGEASCGSAGSAST